MFNGFIKKYAEMSYADLVKIARKSLKDCEKVFNKVDSEYSGLMATVITVNAALMADGKLTIKEEQFIKDVTGIDEELLKSFVKKFTGKEFQIVDYVADTANEEEKMAILNLIATIVACDGRIDISESDFIRKVLE